MKHFLITRFNLRASRWQSAKDGSPVLSEKWLKKRFELFESYCLPSVKNQSNQNFTWLVCFDINTPKLYRDKANNLSISYPNFHPIFIDGIDNMKNGVIKEIENIISKKDKFIITSRLDNDDLIHKEYIKTIQSIMEPIDLTVIDLKRGFQVTLGEPYPQIRKIYNEFNPYISLIESTDNFKTVFDKDHKLWRESKSVINYSEKELWCEIVHGQNLLNTTNANAFRKIALDKDDFFYKGKELRDSPLVVYRANYKLILKRILLKFKK